MKILLINHQNAYTGAPITLLEFCEIFHLTHQLYLYNMDKINSPINIKAIILEDLPKDNEFDLVIFNTLVSLNIKVVGIKNILWIHETSLKYYNDDDRIFDYIICDSIDVYNLSKNKYKYKNIKVINPINFNNFTFQPYVVNDRVSFGNFGIISEKKNQIDIIKVFSSLPNNYQNQVRLYLINKNKGLLLRNYYYYLKYNRNIIFLPLCDYCKIESYYNKIDIYISSSKEEPFGKTLIESMEKGKPILASNNGSHKFLIKNNINGFIYNDLKELRNYIIKLVDNKNLIKELSIKSNQEYNNTFLPKKLSYKKEWNTILSSLEHQPNNHLDV